MRSPACTEMERHCSWQKVQLQGNPCTAWLPSPDFQKYMQEEVSLLHWLAAAWPAAEPGNRDSRGRQFAALGYMMRCCTSSPPDRSRVSGRQTPQLGHSLAQLGNRTLPSSASAKPPQLLKQQEPMYLVQSVATFRQGLLLTPCNLESAGTPTPFLHMPAASRGTHCPCCLSGEPGDSTLCDGPSRHIKPPHLVAPVAGRSSLDCPTAMPGVTALTPANSFALPDCRNNLDPAPSGLQPLVVCSSAAACGLSQLKPHLAFPEDPTALPCQARA